MIVYFVEIVIIVGGLFHLLIGRFGVVWLCRLFRLFILGLCGFVGGVRGVLGVGFLGGLLVGVVVEAVAGVVLVVGVSVPMVP